MSGKIKHDDDGAEYVELEGERESGDGEGDKNFIIGSALTDDELRQLGIEVEKE